MQGLLWAEPKLPGPALNLTVLPITPTMPYTMVMLVRCLLFLLFSPLYFVQPETFILFSQPIFFYLPIVMLLLKSLSLQLDCKNSNDSSITHNVRGTLLCALHALTHFILLNNYRTLVFL